MSTNGHPFPEAVVLRKQGRAAEALAVLKEALRRGQLDAEGVDRAGRLVRKLLPDMRDEIKATRILIVGQSTTNWLATALAAVAWGHGSALEVSEGGYDNVLQDLATAQTGEAAPDLVILLPWSGRLLRGDGPSPGRIEDEVSFWKQAWEIASVRLGARIVQVGHDWLVPDDLGHHLGGRDGGPVALVRRANDALRSELPPGSFFVDLEQVSGLSGRSSFYDPRRYFWTKQPFSERGVHELAEHLWAACRALTSGPKKVLVLDLDNTLWGGVVGEVGPLGISLGDSPEGEAFGTFQKHVKGLTNRGVLLALASKNNAADAIEPFEKNPDMLLKLDDFAAVEICWEPKGTTIARLAQTLGLGLDSFVFFDDNPAEREQVRQALPEVAVVEVPEDPSEYVRALHSGLWFEASGLTAEDHARAEQYAVERKRRQFQQSATSLDDYLRSLEMLADVREFDEADLPRVVQLLGKTNQFNLTARRHSRDDVLSLIGREGSVGLTLQIRDRFGDHGLVAVMIAVPDDGEPRTLRIDTWLMSCRVIGRTVEHTFFNVLLDRARAAGFERIVGEYVPTKKNAQVASLYDDLGFRRRDDPEGVASSIVYEISLAEAKRPATFVAVKGTVSV